LPLEPVAGSSAPTPDAIARVTVFSLPPPCTPTWRTLQRAASTIVSTPAADYQIASILCQNPPREILRRQLQALLRDHQPPRSFRNAYHTAREPFDRACLAFHWLSMSILDPGHQRTVRTRRSVGIIPRIADQ